MDFRQTSRSDLGGILKIYDSARHHMSENGNPNQWTGGYPDEKIILSDIENGNHFGCFKNDRIKGCFTLIEGEDPAYSKIIKGKWIDDAPYAVIHRIAVIEHGQGIGSNCIRWCLNRCGNIRIDTHMDNISMQKLLAKNGFIYCGMILNPWGDERLAFQKIEYSKENP